MSRLIDNPTHWRDRARETRALAEQMDDPEVRRVLLEIAGRYNRIAEKAGERKSHAGPAETRSK